MINFGAVPASSVLPIFFDSFAASTGASSTISGLAVTDIEIYKGTSMTQRSSDAGYVLLDTDGIDLDGITGINGFSIDLGDNTDAGFFVAGSYYNVVVSAITVDSQTVNFVAATFRIVAAENTAGTPVADTTRLAGQTVTAGAGVTFPATVASTTNITAGTMTTTTNLTNLPSIPNNWLTAAGIAANALNGKGDWLLASSAPTNFSALAITAGGAVTAGTVSDKTGYALTAAYDAAKTAADGSTVATSFSSLQSHGDGAWATATGFSTLDATQVEDAVWDATLAGHLDPGSTGEALNAAGAAGDPWITPLPGTYIAGQAGFLVGNALAGGIIDVSKMNGATVLGDGTSGNLWRG